MRADRTIIHVAKPTDAEHPLLRLLTPSEKHQAMLAAARAKAARIGAKKVRAGNAARDPAHQDG